MGRTEPYSIPITRWEWMRAALVLAVAARHDDQSSRVAAALGLAEDAAEELIVAARTDPGTAVSLASIEIEPDSWERMLARMLVAVVAEAPTQRAASHLLGLTRRELRGELRRARRRVCTDHRQT